jgi:polar amino acid transport system substrate-binding protein
VGHDAAAAQKRKSPAGQLRNKKFPCGLAASLLISGALCSCTQGTTASAGPPANTLNEIKKRGELRAGYHVEPPSITRDAATGKLGGAFIHAIEQIAAGLQVKMTPVEVGLADFAAGLRNNQYDVSLGPTFKTIPRAQGVAYTNSIYYLGYTGVVKKGTAAKYRDQDAIDRAGVRLAVKSGSPIEQYARDHCRKATIMAIEGADLSVPLQAVSQGNADVGLMNEHTVEFYARDHPDVEIVLADHPWLMAGMAWTVRYGESDWLTFLNTSLEVLLSTGQIAIWERENYSGKALRRTAPELWGGLQPPGRGN